MSPGTCDIGVLKLNILNSVIKYKVHLHEKECPLFRVGVLTLAILYFRVLMATQIIMSKYEPVSLPQGSGAKPIVIGQQQPKLLIAGSAGGKPLLLSAQNLLNTSTVILQPGGKAVLLQNIKPVSSYFINNPQQSSDKKITLFSKKVLAYCPCWRWFIGFKFSLSLQMFMQVIRAVMW